MNLERETEILSEIEPMVLNCGFKIVEFHANRQRDRLKFALTLFGENGLSIADCAKVHKTILPKLEMLCPNDDVYIDVMSPGIERVLKSSREYKIFTGQIIRVLLVEGDDWFKATIEAADVGSVTLLVDNKKVSYDYDSIQKAKLDYRGAV